MPAPTQLPPFLATALQETSGEPNSHPRAVRSSKCAVVMDAVRQTTAGNASVHSQDEALSPSTLAAAGVVTTEGGAADTLDRLTSSSALLVPPLNFDMVCSARNTGRGPIYRSGFPNERNFPFLATLQLRTVVYLAADDVRPNLQRWVDASHGRVQLLHFRLSVNKEPFGEMDQETVAAALRVILDRRHLPMLIHCNKGKYRVGVITALLRRMQGWSLTSIYDEYARFAGADRVADEEFIDMFPLHMVPRADGQPANLWLS